MISEHNIIDTYLKAGWKLIPVRNKVPLIQEWTTLDITSELVNSWRLKFTSCDWGVVLKDFVVFDCDGDGAEEEYQTFGFPETLTCKTRRGFHHYFKMTGDIRNAQDITNTKDKGYQIDIRGNGGYCVIPPSAGYSWSNKTAIQPLPLDAYQRRFGQIRTGDSTQPGESVRGVSGVQWVDEKWANLKEGEGRRPKALSLIGRLISKGHNLAETYALISAWNALNEPPIDDTWVRTEIHRTWNKHVKQEDRDNNLDDGLDQFIAKLQLRATQKEPALTTGFKGLDGLLWGFTPGELHAVLANANIGKTALTLYMGYTIARKDKKVLFFGTESGRSSLIGRIFCIFYPIRALACQGKSQFTTDEQVALNEAMKEWKTRDFKISEIGAPKLQDIQKAVARVKPDILFVDSLQFCDCGYEGYFGYPAFCRGLKELAKEHNIPVVLTNHLRVNQYVDLKTQQKVTIDSDGNDAKLSKALRDVADVVLVLNRRVNKITKDTFIKITVDKARDARIGDVYTQFIPEYLRFKEIPEADFLAGTKEPEQ